MSEITELRQLIVKQHLAIGRAGKFLGEMGLGNGPKSDEAWAIFSELNAVAAEVKAIVDRDLPPSSHGREGAE